MVSFQFGREPDLWCDGLRPYRPRGPRLARPVARGSGHVPADLEQHGGLLKQAPLQNLRDTWH